MIFINKIKVDEKIKTDENNLIYEQLNKIDEKSIRAIRENDTVRIESLEAEAVALRAKLQ